MAGGAISPAGGGNVPAVAPKANPAPAAPPAATTQQAAPAATSDLSANAPQTRVDMAYERMNQSITNGVNNQDPEAQAAARGLVRSSVEAVQHEAAQHAKDGTPYDPDAGFAAHIASGGAQELLGGEKSPDPNAPKTKTLTDMSASALNYLEARKAALVAENGGQMPQPPAN